MDLGVQVREKSSDLFALAVHIHLMLMAGNHTSCAGNGLTAESSPPRCHWRDRDTGRAGPRHHCEHTR
jgi:hypothetical protein